MISNWKLFVTFLNICFSRINAKTQKSSDIVKIIANIATIFDKNNVLFSDGGIRHRNLPALLAALCCYGTSNMYLLGAT